MNSDIPVQVDGEPWVQSPGDVVVLKSALKVSFQIHFQCRFFNLLKFQFNFVNFFNFT